MSTKKGMSSNATDWTEPTQINDEYVIKKSGFTVKGTDESVANNPNEQLQRPPRIASPNIAGMPKRRLAKASKSWGAKLIAAGADPSGRRSSHAAFTSLMRTEATIEIPAGRFIFDKPLVIDETVITRRFLGADKESTILRAAGDFPVVEIRGHALAKSGGALNFNTEFDNQTFEGGSAGIQAHCYGGSGCPTPSCLITNCTFRNLSNYGLHYTPGGHEFDQVAIYNTTFQDIGQYGIYIQRFMIDKQGYLKCIFKDIGKAGIFYDRTSMIAGTIYECAFENIGGPGIDIYPVAEMDAASNPPHCSMFSKLSFVNCGTSSRAAFDAGFLENGALVDIDVKITDGRAVKYGVIGTGPYFDRCSVLVDNGSIGAAAFGFRQSRLVRNARPMGSITRECYANTGGMKFVYNDVPDISGPYGALQLKSGYNGFNYSGPKWWQASDPTSQYPWAYPHLMSNCDFGDGEEIDYILFRNKKDGSIAQQVVIQGAAVSLGRAPRLQQRAKPGLWTVHDIRGRVIGVCAAADARMLKQRGIARGAYLLRKDGVTKRVAPLHVR